MVRACRPGHTCGAKPCVGSHWSPQLRMVWGRLRAVDRSHCESPQWPGVGLPSQSTANSHPVCYCLSVRQVHPDGSVAANIRDCAHWGKGHRNQPGCSPAEPWHVSPAQHPVPPVSRTGIQCLRLSDSCPATNTHVPRTWLRDASSGGWRQYPCLVSPSSMSFVLLEVSGVSQVSLWHSAEVPSSQE